MIKEVVNGKDGKPIILTPQEMARASLLQRDPGLSLFNQEMKNSLGYEIDITTLFSISKRIIEQKFFTIAPAEYMPVRVGDNAWATEILTYLDFSVAGDFEKGNINTGASNSRLAEASGGVSSVTNKIINWAKGINWSFFDLQLAARSGNWDVVTSKERARKKNWDLGIQSIAFLGAQSDPTVMGLLTQSAVNSNTSLITGYINAMNVTAFEAFIEGLMEAYRSNAARTAYPTHFTIPESDYNGLAVATDETFPIKSKLERMLESFRLITRNPKFQVLPCAYADQATNASVAGLNKNRYSLYNYDEDSMRMDIPVDYTNTLQNTINGFNFQNVGYGQYTGLLAYRPLEMLYFDWAS